VLPGDVLIVFAQVRLRSEYRDSQDSIEVEHLRYLENPPEVNYKVCSLVTCDHRFFYCRANLAATCLL
jgi:hypothetical protein